MKLIKDYIKKFVRNNRFIRNHVMTLNMLYFGKTIFQENSLLSSVLNFNHLIEKKYKENFINEIL